MRKTEVMTKLKSNKAITLIALVITIIVLLILAGVAISMLSGENGILKQAAKSKLETERANLAEDIKVAYLSSLSSGKGKVDYKVLNEELEKIGFDRGEEQEDGTYLNDITGLPTMVKINGEEYTITNDGDSGKSGTWTYKKDENGRKTIVSNGVIDLPIGTYINYNAAATDADETTTKQITYKSPTGTYVYGTPQKAPETTVQGSGNKSAQTFSNKTETNGWRVLGVNEETNEMLIISADSVKTTSNSYYHLSGYTGAQYGELELDNIGEIFGKGYGATGGRSVDVNDINKITGYNPNNVGVYDPDQTGTGTKYEQGKIDEYENEVTYSWTETLNKLSLFGKNGVTSTDFGSAYGECGFNWFDSLTNKWKNSTQDIDNPLEIATIKLNAYKYYPYSLTTSYSTTGTQNGISITSDEYLTLFYDSTGTKRNTYWLATSSVSCSGSIGYGVLFVNQCVQYSSLYTSSGGKSGLGLLYVRPVVSLKADIKLQYDSVNSYYDIID